VLRRSRDPEVNLILRVKDRRSRVGCKAVSKDHTIPDPWVSRKDSKVNKGRVNPDHTHRDLRRDQEWYYKGNLHEREDRVFLLAMVRVRVRLPEETSQEDLLVSRDDLEADAREVLSSRSRKPVINRLPPALK